MNLLRYRRVLLWLFVPFVATIVALLGRWGSSHEAFAYPLVSIVELAFVSVLWRVSDGRLRTLFVASIGIAILGNAVNVYILQLFHFSLGGIPVWNILLEACMFWAAVALVEMVGKDLRLTRISQVVSLAALLGAAAIVFLLQDFQQLLLFAFFPVAYFSFRRPDQRLALGIVFFGGVALELYGTFMGAWTWMPSIGGLAIGRGLLNPPYGAGGLYALGLALALVLAQRLEPAIVPSAPSLPARRPMRKKAESIPIA